MTQNVIKTLSIKGPNLLASSSRELLAKLDSIAKEIESWQEKSPPAFHAVLLLQQEGSGRGDENWYQALSDDLLYDDLTKRMHYVREVFERISESSIPWYYATNTYCYGDFFELAMSCRSILAFDDQIKVGFPDIPGGLFPYGGVFAGHIFADKKLLSFWQEKPIRKVTEAVTEGVVGFAMRLEGASLEEASIDWIKSDLETISPDRRSSINRRHHTPRYQNRFYHRDSSKILSDLKKEYFSAAFESSFPMCVDLSKQTKIRKEHKAQLLVSLCAHQCFKPLYLNSLYQRLQLDRKKPFSLSRSRTVMPLYINVEKILPPAFSMYRILNSGGCLILSAQSYSALKRGVEVTYAQLSRLGAQKLTKLWDRQVSFGVQTSKKGLVRLSSLANDSLLISYEGKKIPMQRAAQKGWESFESVCEVHKKGDDKALFDGIEWLVPMLCDLLVLSSPIGAGQMFCSTFLKSKIFEQLLYATSSQVPFETVLQELKDQGWLSLGPSAEWDRFLSTRHAVYGHDAKGYKVGTAHLDQDIWEIGTLKEAAQVAASLPKKEATFTPQVTSQRLVLLSGMMASSFYQEKLVDSLWHADILCGATAGFPSHLGSPLGRLGNLGWPRVSYELRQIFPMESEGLTKFI